MTDSSQQDFDVVIIGAGFTGLHQLYRLREMGLSVCAIEAGGGVGGTWYWNRYPGARCDSTSETYQYWFSRELLNEWEWSERFPSQPEVLEYLKFAANKFDLLKDIRFNTRVNSAVFNEDTSAWDIQTDSNKHTAQALRSRFLITAVGALTKPQWPNIPGLDEFAGERYHSCRWPHEGVDFSGKRVAVIGTGATGIQVIQEVAKQADDLVVFQRTANFAIPIRNPRYDAQDHERLRGEFSHIREQSYQSFAGFEYDLIEQPPSELSEEERQQTLERLWADGSLQFWVGNFAEILIDEKANEMVAEFVRRKIRERVTDPETAEMLCPNGYAFGSKRVPLENGYFEAFNQDNVHLVDLNKTPITGITQAGIDTEEASFDVDVVVLATGFDAVTGALLEMDIRGLNGQRLAEHWANGPSAYLGLQTSGFPNLFMLTGPTAPSAAFCNHATCAQDQVDWIANAIQYTQEQGAARIQAKQDAEQAWMAHAAEVADATLVPKANSWWLGANIPGKHRTLLAYIGGAPAYRAKCQEVVDNDYEGFELAR